MALADLNVRLGLITKSFERSLSDVDRKLRRFQRNIEGIGRDLTQSITLPLAGIGAAAVKSFADLEAGANALAVTSRDAQTGVRSLEDQIAALREIAKLPGLGFEEAVKGSARLQAVGLSSRQAEEALAAFGNAVARSGGGRVELEGALLALTQIASKGKISAEEINQLNERIFEIRPALEAAFGTSNSEELQKLGVSSEEFIAKITEQLGELEKVQGGLSNSFENLGDSVRTNLARVGDIINKTFDIGGIIERLDAGLSGLVDRFAGLDESTQRTILKVAAFAAAIGPALIGVAKLASLTRLAATGFGSLVSAATLLPKLLITLSTPVASLSAAFTVLTKGIAVMKASFIGFFTNPVGIAIAAIGILVAGFVTLYNRSERFRDGISALGAAIKQTFQSAFGNIQNLITSFIALIKTIGSAIKSFVEVSVAGIKSFAERYRGALDSVIQFLKKLFDINVTIFDGILKTVGGFVSGLIGLFNRLFSIISETVSRFREGFDSIKDGDIGAALKSFGQGLVKANPINLFFSEGRNLADGFKEGFARGFENFSVKKFAERFNTEFQKQIQDAQKTVTVTVPNVTATGAAPAAGIGRQEDFERSGAKLNDIEKTVRNIRAELDAISTKKTLLGPAFDADAEKAKILQSGVEKLAELGVSVDNEDLKVFSAQLSQITNKPHTVPLNFNTSNLAAQLKGLTNLSNQPTKVTLPGVSEAQAALQNLENQFNSAARQAEIFGTSSGDLLSQKLSITQSALQNAVTQFGSSSEAVAVLREQYVLLTEQMRINAEEQQKQQEQLALVSQFAGTLGAGLTEFFTALEQGSKNAFKSFVDGFKKAMVELLKRLAIALAQALAVAAILSIIFPGSSGAAGGFGKIFGKVLGGGLGLPGFAEGGIVPPGFPNDTFPARLSSNEAIIPLEKLPSLMGAVQEKDVIIPNLLIRGQDFVIAFEKAKNAYNRYS